MRWLGDWVKFETTFTLTGFNDEDDSAKVDNEEHEILICEKSKATKALSCVKFTALHEFRGS